MSSRTTIIWLLIAVILGAAAVVLLRTGKSGSDAGAGVVALGQPVLQIDPSKLTGLKIAHPPHSQSPTSPGGDSERIDRGAAIPGGAAAWVMRVSIAGSPPASGRGNEPAWPLAAGRIESLVRLLNDSRARAIPEKNATLGDNSTIVTIEQAGMHPITVRLADRSIAGTALVEIDDPNLILTSADGTRASGPSARRASIDDRLHELFRGAAPREWRDRTALSGLSLDVSRIRLENDRGSIVALGRLQGRWSVREPFPAPPPPADPAAVQRLLTLVNSVQIADFLDAGTRLAPGRTTGFEKPAATVRIEIDRRDPAASTTEPVRVEQRELALGGAADARGDRLFARIDGTRTVIIDARAVAGLRLDPTLFVWPFATHVQPSEIGTIVIRKSAETGDSGRVLQRQLDKWKEMRAAGGTTPASELPLADSEIKSIDALLTFLTGGKPEGASASRSGGGDTNFPAADATIISTPPSGYRTIGSVLLLSLASAPLDSIEVGRVDSTLIVLKTGPIYRAYPVDRTPALLTDLLRASDPPSTTKANEPEANK